MNRVNTQELSVVMRWWESRSFLFAVALISAAPLLWPQIPPLVDLPGHIGRYRVELDLYSSADLQRFYDFRWALIGNLGVDLLVVPLAPILGLESAVKLIVASIPVLTALGIFAVAREVHGRVPPTALFAVPFVYGYPFNYGFVNFALSVGFALLAFALWLRLSRPGKIRFRAFLFAPLSCALWLVHVFGWGFLGLLAFSAEMVRFRDNGLTWLIAARKSAFQMLPLSIPFALMILWRSGEGGGVTGTFFFLVWKLLALVSALRDRWLVWDSLGVAVAMVLIGAAIFDRRMEFSRRISIPAVVLLIAFMALPFVLFGSAHADMRLAPYIFIVALLAVRERRSNFQIERRLAVLGLAFLACRIAGNTVSFAIADSDARDELRALDYIPRGAAVLTLPSGGCNFQWEVPRHGHFGSFVIARKYGFSNDQWQIPGGQLLTVRYPAAAPFEDANSARVHSPHCASLLNQRNPLDRARTTQESLHTFPRDAFDYVWLIKPPEGAFVAPADLTPVWSNGDSRLYRVEK